MTKAPYVQVLALLQVIPASLDHFFLLGLLFPVPRIWLVAEMILQGSFKFVVTASVKSFSKCLFSLSLVSVV